MPRTDEVAAADVRLMIAMFITIISGIALCYTAIDLPESPAWFTLLFVEFFLVGVSMLWTATLIRDYPKSGTPASAAPPRRQPVRLAVRPPHWRLLHFLSWRKPVRIYRRCHPEPILVRYLPAKA